MKTLLMILTLALPVAAQELWELDELKMGGPALQNPAPKQEYQGADDKAGMQRQAYDRVQKALKGNQTPAPADVKASIETVKAEIARLETELAARKAELAKLEALSTPPAKDPDFPQGCQ